MISVFTIRFLGMPDLVMWSEITLDVAFWVKNPRWSNNKLLSFSK